MKPKQYITMALAIVAVTAGVATTALLTGCQAPGRVLSTTPSAACPMCETRTVTSPIMGLTVKKHVCPGCKEVSAIDPTAPASMQDYVDPNQRTIHVCEHCKAAVSKCPQCRKQ